MAFFYLMLLLELGIIAAAIAGLWAVFVKAGEPGWAAVVPIYNIIVLLKIVDKPVWWIVLFLIPCVNIVGAILVALELARKFNVGGGFAVGLILLPFVFYPILGFGSAEYEGRPSGTRKKKRRIREEEEEDFDDEPRPSRRRKRQEEDEFVEAEVVEAPAPARAVRAAPPPPQPPPGLKVTCPHCRATVRIPPGFPGGKQVNCPRCKGPFLTPG